MAAMFNQLADLAEAALPSEPSTSGVSNMAASARANELFGCRGKKVLVTGGSKGIGRAVVEDFARLGARVFTCARNAEDLTKCLTEARTAGLDVQGAVIDVSVPEQRADLLAQVTTAFGGQLDVLVNNVGTNIRKATVDYTAEDYQTLMSTNLDSAFALCQLCHPLLKASGSGVILFNSSVAGGPTCLRSGSIYAMTKAAMNQLTKNLSVEWAKDNIRVNAVAPWYTASDLANVVLKDANQKAGVLARTPLGRIAQPSEISSVMVFLAGPGAAFITGQTLAVDGGYSVMGWW